jgi:hypothetical protein
MRYQTALHPDELKWSEQQDLNLRPLSPQLSALPDCAMFRNDEKWSGVTDLNRRSPAPKAGALPDYANARSCR